MAWVQSLFKGLRSRKPCGAAKKFFKNCISLKLIFSCSLNFSTHFTLTQSKNSINSSSYYYYPISLSEDKPVFCTVHSSPLLKSLKSLMRKALPLTPFTPLKLSLKTPTSFQLWSHIHFMHPPPLCTQWALVSLLPTRCLQNTHKPFICMHSVSLSSS